MQRTITPFILFFLIFHYAGKLFEIPFADETSLAMMTGMIVLPVLFDWFDSSTSKLRAKLH